MQVPFDIMLAFVGWCFALWLLVFLRAGKERREIILATCVGMVGGMVIDIPYQRDFWQPEWWPLGSAAFGGSSLGAFIGLHLFWVAATGERLEREVTQSVARWTKVRLLIGIVILWALMHFWLGLSSVVATANALWVGVVWMLIQRTHDWRDIRFAAFGGIWVALATFGFTVGGFMSLLPFFVDVRALAMAHSSYFAQYGADWTAAALIHWFVAFGAFWGAATLWGHNRHFRHAS